MQTRGQLPGLVYPAPTMQTRQINAHRRDNPLLAGLVSFWKLDESSGARVDAHGPHDLADNNTVTQSAGKIGDSAQFTSANAEWLSNTDSELNVGTGSASWSAWVYFDSHSAFSGILGKYLEGSGYLLWHYNNGTGFVMAAYDSTAAYHEISIGANATTGEWHHIYAQYDNDTRKLGISINNGVIIESAALPIGGIADSSNSFNLGKNDGGLNYHNGRIDEVGMWRRKLTTDERSLLYNSGSGISYPF